MIDYKPNGDIYFLGVRTFIGYKQRPPRWLEAAGAVVALIAILFIATVFMSADALVMVGE